MAELMPGGRSVGRIFRGFHSLVAETVERLESASWPAEGPFELDEPRAPIVAAIGRIAQQLAEDPPVDPGVARQLLYLLAVYADDRVMAADWPGGRAWGARRIEAELFDTALGPAEVEARCERLLAVPTPENRQLARLFLYAYGLGMGGAAAADGERLAALRRRLLEFARPARQPAPPGRRRLFRQAYRYTAARDERRLLPDLRGWLFLAAALLVVFALLSTVAWDGAVEGISRALAAPRGATAPAPVADEAEGASEADPDAAEPEPEAVEEPAAPADEAGGDEA